MSVPALRQPKTTKVVQNDVNQNKIYQNDYDYVIVTLQNKKKLVVSFDSYHAIISIGDMYKCVLCDMEMELNNSIKESHVKQGEHKKCMETYPHVEDFAENLIRMISKENSYCTICNVLLPNTQLPRHIKNYTHCEELSRAEMRADTYKPCQ